MDHGNAGGNRGSWADGAAAGMSQGMAIIPYSLLRHYRKLGLTDREAMLLIHLIGFQQVEFKAFPSLEELSDVTGIPAASIAPSLQRLMKDGLLGIDEYVDGAQGIHYERYNLGGLYKKLADCMAEEDLGHQPDRIKPQSPLSSRGGSAPPDSSGARTVPEKEERNLFTIFEKEFGRPLSPMELETISGWVDADRYPDELILLALKEAVFAGKLHFRYIDRILLEWSRNRVRTAQDARAYTQKFRNIGR